MMPDPTDAWRAFAREPTEMRFQPLYEGTKRLVWTLALRVLRHPEDAADAFQSSYARLIEEARGPAGAAPPEDLTGFICRIAIREADRIRKRRARRGSKEAPLRGDEPMKHAQPVEEAAARREVRDRVEALVADLPERYRLPVELHFFHGLSQREVAAALGKPLATVSDRIRAALRKLDPAFRRAGLGRPAAMLGGIALTGALLEPPLHAGAVFAEASSAAAAASASSLHASFTVTTALAGALTLMKAKLVPLVISLVFLALGAGIVHRSFQSGRTPEVAREPEPTVVDPTGPAVALGPATEPEKTADPDAAVEPAREVPRNIVTGRIVDSVTGEPLAGARIVESFKDVEASSGEDGTYVLEGLGEGVHEIIARAPGHAERSARVSHPGKGESIQDIALDPAVEVTVEVVDEDGAAIEGSRVTPSVLGEDNIFHGGEGRDAVTDGAGIAVIHGVSRIRPQQLMVAKKGYESAYARPDVSAARALRVVLEQVRERERAITGRVTDPRGNPIAGAIIEWKDGESTQFGTGAQYGQFRAETDRGGRYRLVWPDDYDSCILGVAAAGYAPHIHQGARPGTPDAPLVLDFVLEDGHWLRGRVVGEDGRGLARARVLVMPRIDLLNAAMAYPAVMRETRTDEEGRFALEDLPGPKAAVRVRCDCPAPERNEEIDVDREVDLVVREAGILRGIVVDASTGEPVNVFRVKCPSDSRSSTSFTSPEGKFELRNIRRDRPVDVLVEAEGYAPLEVEGIEAAVASSSTERRFALVRGTALEGVVLDAVNGEPLAGIQVSASSDPRLRDIPAHAWGRFRDVFGIRELVTGPDGGFRFMETEPGLILFRAKGRRTRLVPAVDRDGLRGPDGKLQVVLDTGETLRGSLRLGGKPARSVPVKIEALFTGADGKPLPKPIALAETETDAGGEFGWQDLAPGKYRLFVERSTDEPRPGFEVTISREVEIAAGEAATVALGESLGDTTVRGRIAGLEEHISVYASVVIRPAGDPEAERLTFKTYRSWDWRFACPYLKPGRWAVEVSWYEKEGEGRAELPPIEVERPGAEIEIRVDPRK